MSWKQVPKQLEFDDPVTKLVSHIIAVAEDPYLLGNPEWLEILRDTLPIVIKANEQEFGPNAMPSAEEQLLDRLIEGGAR